MCLITIYTQAYNSEKYIKKCIESVLSQTFSDFEYIIVDNGSTDNTTTIINDFAKNDGRIKNIRFDENRMGFWPALIKDIAKGKYFSTLDSDDWLEPTYLETLFSFAENEDLDIAIGGSCFHHIETNTTSYRKSDKQLVIEKKSIPMIFSFAYQFFRPIWGKLYKMDLIKNIDISDCHKIINLGAGYGADTIICLDALNLAEKIGFCDKVLHNYLLHPKSASYKYNPDRFYSNTFLFHKAETFLSQFGKISDENYHFLYITYIYAIFDTIKVITSSNLGMYEKFSEIEKILRDELTQQALNITHNYDAVKTIINALISFFTDCKKANSNNTNAMNTINELISLLIFN